MKKSVLKKVLAFVLSLAMLVTGLYIVQPEAEEAKAADAVASESHEYSTTEVANYWGKVPADVPEDKIFAGWYKDAECTEKVEAPETEYVAGGKTYAKFVDKEVFSLKMQVGDNGSKLRLISSVDSLDYSRVGFEVTINGKTITWDTDAVLERINASQTGVTYKYSPKVVDADSEYFVTGTLTGITTDNMTKTFYVRPYVKTLDGATSYGLGRMFTVKDGEATEYFNVAVPGTEVAAGTEVDVKVDGADVKAKVVGSKDGYVHLNVQKARADLASTAVVTYGENTAIYENLKSKDDVDTSWYDADPSADTYYISTAADFWGLHNIVNGINETKFDFYKKTIVIVSDINVNGVADTAAADWAKNGVPSTELVWTPGYDFYGTLDGNKNEISGLYITNGNDATKDGIGLFRNMYGTVKNLYMDNTYVKTNLNNGFGYWSGAIAGTLRGILDTIYVGQNVYINSASPAVGGLAGRIGVATSKDFDAEIKNSCFAGTIAHTNNNAGGMVGQVTQQSSSSAVQAKIENCLVTGTINGSARVGQFVGNMSGASGYPAGLVIKNSLGLGTTTATTTDGTHAAIVGQVASYATLELEDVYSTSTIAGTSKVQGVGLIVETVKGLATIGVTSDSIKGNAAYETLGFDFYGEHNKDGVWVAAKNGNPELKAFSSLKDEEIQMSYTGENGPIAHTGWYNVKNYQNGTFVETNGDGITFEIETAADLYGLQKKSQEEDFWKNTIKFTKSIDLNPGLDLTKAEDRAKATTILPMGKMPDGTLFNAGTGNDGFWGNIDGNGYTLSGMYIEAISNYNGFVSEQRGTKGVTNLTIDNSYLDSNGYSYNGLMGGLAIDATTDGVYVKENVVIDTGVGTPTGGLIGEIRKAKIINSNFSGTINVNSQINGGIVGNVHTKTSDGLVLENCIFEGTINSTYTSDNNGARLGGLVGRIWDVVTIRKCVSNGTINAALDKGALSSVAGYVTYNLTLNDVYASTNIRVNGNESVEAPEIKSNITVTGAATQLSDIQIKGYGAVKNMSALDFTETGAWVPTVYGPQLKAFADPTTIVYDTTYTDWYTEDMGAATYEIGTAAELYYFQDLANSGVDFTGKTIQLTADVDLNEGFDATNASLGSTAIMWDGITTFNGTFDGNYKTISGVYYKTSGDYGGFFRALETSSIVKNLKLDNAYFAAMNTAWWYGSLVGNLKGDLENVHAGKNVRVVNTSNGSLFGGLVGMSNDAGVSIKNCSFAGTVDGKINPGGIVGRVNADLYMENCYNSGTLIGNHPGGLVSQVNKGTTTLVSCLNIGKLVASDNAGGSVWCSASEGTTVSRDKIYSVSNIVDSNNGALSDRNSGVAGVTLVTLDDLKSQAADIVATLGSAWEVDATTGLPALIFKLEQ